MAELVELIIVTIGLTVYLPAFVFAVAFWLGQR